MGRPLRHVDLMELGLQKYDVERLLRNGRLQHAYGRYVDGSLDEPLARAACAQAAHPRSVISHFTAAHLTGLRVWTGRDRQTAANPIWLSCEPGSRRNLKRTDVVLHRAGLTARDLQLYQGLWLTSDARTTVDIARELPLREAAVTVDHALSGSVSLAELEAVLERQYRWPGVRKARAAVALGDPRSESALESYARMVFADGGLPTPVLQVEFWDGYRWLALRVDFWWPEFRTVGEADGLEKFEAATPSERRRSLRRSFERDQQLSDCGLEVVHFGWEDAVLHPGDLVRRFRGAFERGSRRTGPVPTWRAAAPQTTRPAA
ncbi:hypothetical protein EV651_107297 [Kribbella sp. VKM Ac-2571]|uniref:hypothetical protein n=1 Tax=Kribbella sp. VKM Ac-2571 TaxID=2512222 RepID=UPI0010EA9889|nr:hypothetical protein [Kribbella sp. VKM Ac-2571]TDO61023.1 hypothetical protein EV651_107297 [Kribbella sp. VKM Ac-2571]